MQAAEDKPQPEAVSALQNVKLKHTGLSQSLISPSENTDEQPSHASNLSLATSSPGTLIFLVMLIK